MHSISSFAPGTTSALTTTVVRAGGAPVQKVRYTAFMPAKSAPSMMNTVHFTALSIVVPAISSTRFTFSSVLLVCPSMVVSAFAPRVGSCPDG